MTRQTSLLYAILGVTKGNVATVSENKEVQNFILAVAKHGIAKLTLGDFHFDCNTNGGKVTWNKTGDTTPRTLEY